MTTHRMPQLELVSQGWRIKTMNGYHLEVRPLRLPRLIEVPEHEPRSQGRFWCYSTFEAAVLAGAAWDIDEDTEPVGWVRSGGARV